MKGSEIVTVFLIDGSPAGLVQCTIANWTGVAYRIPRTDLDKYKDRDHLKYSGVYFLFGKSEEDAPVVYIGQSGERKNKESIICRLQEHIRNPDKDYWTEAVAFTTKDNSYEPTEICYLEHKFCEIAKETKRYIVKNGNDPNPGSITEEKESELATFIDYSKLVMGILGHKVFEKKVYSGVEFYITKKHEKATCKRTSEGFIVLAGSYINQNVSDYLPSGYKALPTKYAHLIDSNGKLKEDIPFTSPSAAAAFILGRSANGYAEWKTSDGKSLRDIENEKAN
jgi:hypothetical protein